MDIEGAEREAKYKMAVMAKPINHAFIVRAEKEQEFLNMKADPEVLRKHQERAKAFRKNQQQKTQ